MADAGLTGSGGRLKFNIPFIRDPQLFFTDDFGHIAIMRPASGARPASPMLLQIGRGLVIEISHGKPV